MQLRELLFRPLYHAVVAAGRPVGGIRPRRIYDLLGRLAFRRPTFRRFRNRWGHELELSPYYHIDRNILIFGAYDLPLHLALQRLVRPGDVCFDVGANLGEMSLHMTKLAGPSGQVFAFEPAPPVFARLARHVALNRSDDVVHCLPIALSDQTGRCEIVFAAAEQDNQGLGSIVDSGAKPGSQRAVVPVSTLDDFVAERRIVRLDLMKIDIQGAEIRLLEGGRQTLTTLSPDLLLEVSPEDLACMGKSSIDLLRLLESLGYVIHHLTSRGVGRRIRADEVAATFAATNVYCTRRSEPCP